MRCRTVRDVSSIKVDRAVAFSTPDIVGFVGQCIDHGHVLPIADFLAVSHEGAFDFTLVDPVIHNGHILYSATDLTETDGALARPPGLFLRIVEKVKGGIPYSLKMH